MLYNPGWTPHLLCDREWLWTLNCMCQHAQFLRCWGLNSVSTSQASSLPTDFIVFCNSIKCFGVGAFRCFVFGVTWTSYIHIYTLILRLWKVSNTIASLGYSIKQNLLDAVTDIKLEHFRVFYYLTVFTMFVGTSIIPALSNLRLESCHEFKATLGITISSRITWVK